MKRVTVTIGIAAYNEAVTLPRLLKDIARQHTKVATIEQVMVVSDGSTDETAVIASQWNALPMMVHEQKRQGKAAALNYIFSHAKTDVVIILDADVRLPDTMMIERLIAHMLQSEADLVGARVDYQKPINLVQTILAASCDMKEYMFSRINGGDTIYTCHGRARAFSRRFYTAFSIPNSINEDAYSYLFAKMHGYRYAYAPQATVLYRLPKTIKDHAKQSVRFQSSKIEYDESTQQVAKRAYHISPFLFLKANLTVALKKPQLLLYHLMSVYIALTYMHEKPHGQTWTVSSSSKL